MRDKCSMRKTVLSAIALVVFVSVQNCFCLQSATGEPTESKLTPGFETGKYFCSDKPAPSDDEKTDSDEVQTSESDAQSDDARIQQNSLDSMTALPAQIDDHKPVYKYVGNSFSFKFHRPSCPFARAMWRGHVVKFQYRKQAIDAGQKPCRYCLPPYWKSVGAKILRATPESQEGLSTVENVQNLPTVNAPKKDVKSTAGSD